MTKETRFKFFHFTAAHLAEKIKREGITLGGVLDWSVIRNSYFLHHGIWLTTDMMFHRQTWAKGPTIPYDRAAVRITVRVPFGDKNIFPWSEFSARIFPPVVQELNNGYDPQNWWVYHGQIPLEWCEEFYTKNSGVVVTQ